MHFEKHESAKMTFQSNGIHISNGNCTVRAWCFASSLSLGSNSDVWEIGILKISQSILERFEG